MMKGSLLAQNSDDFFILSDIVDAFNVFTIKEVNTFNLFTEVN